MQSATIRGKVVMSGEGGEGGEGQEQTAVHARTFGANHFPVGSPELER
jgi:hypothetical protein